LCRDGDYLASAQTLTTLHSFDGADGYNPGGAALVQTSDGNFYGTTAHGGTNGNCGINGGCGTVFKITPSGTLTTLYNFSGGSDGAYPSGLVQASDGNFYGATSEGGNLGNCFGEGCGTVFKITPTGTLTTLHIFDETDGVGPTPLVQATDGNFYGTTFAGGANGNCTEGCGTVFKITPAGMLTTLHNFGGTDGYWPSAGLVQATDENFYGTTYAGGPLATVPMVVARSSESPQRAR